MFRRLTSSMVLCAGLLMATSAATALPWPSGSTPTDIGGDLPSGFEPSGIVWDDYTGALWVVDNEGNLARMLRDGDSTDVWPVEDFPDLESVAVTGTSPRLYLGVESSATILEYESSSTGDPEPTGSSWQLGVPVNGNSGMEGLTWVPNGYHPYPASSSGGVFFASSQENGTVYVYDVNLSLSGSTPVYRGEFTPDTEDDISDLYFSKATRTLFVLYGAARKVLEIDTSTASFSLMSSYTLPDDPSDPEGVTLLPQCPGALTDIYIADDTQGASTPVYLYDSFPQLCATTLAPTADATTSQAAPSSALGLQSSLVTDSAASAERDFLIRFSLSGVNTSDINRARLLFYATDGTDQSPQFCVTTASWPESSVTWNTQPSCSSNNQQGGAVVDNDSWVGYNVLTPLKSGWSSFRFTPRSTDDFVARSRQATSSSQRPKLILWMNGQ